MFTAIGRNGQWGLRPACQRILGGGCRPCFRREIRSSSYNGLDLPALDKKWRAKWEEEKQEKASSVTKDGIPNQHKAVLRNWAKMEEISKTGQGKRKRPADDFLEENKAIKEKDQDGLDNESKGRKYVLPMFPYPSGNLHLGHLRVYTISDVLARFHRMQGFEVTHPIGWDAFGLPAENAAIERGVEPATWTKQNIQKMKSQLEAMNGEWDWDRELATCDPTFYKHTQQLFLLLHKAGLAYQAESLVNYDPVDKTVLANEQVDSNGCSWRSGAKVEKKLLKQWFFKISEYRQELLDGLKELEKNGAWPERVLSMQQNWLGKSTGARIKFPVVAYDQQTHSDIEVFTTRPDTLYGVQYVALAATHPIARSLATADVELQAFLDTIPALPQDSKVGYLLPHVRALNPLAYEESTPDATKASLPIYVAPYVLEDYGDGAVMGVPGHDTRDHSFWKHNRYDDPVRFVVSQSPDEATSVLQTSPFVHHGHLTKHSGPHAGLTTADATKRIVNLLKSKGLGSEAETWRLRDWLVSRQRYWGTPIPIIHCSSCGPVPVPDDQLPVELPPVDSHWAKGKTGNPLEHAHDWVNTPCPQCGEAAKRDTDTMDTFVDSSWYFMRFPDPKNPDSPFSAEAANANLPVDLYIGGVEHAILHLLYSRFISKFLATTPLWPNGAKVDGEPFKKLLAQGMVHGKTYSDPSTRRFLKPDEVDLTDPSNPLITATNEVANVSFEKMSKSKYNGVDPGTCMAKYGADATRAHILFQAPVSEVLEWDEEKIAGVTRWLRRLYEMILKNQRVWLNSDKLDQFNPKLYFLNTETPTHRRAVNASEGKDLERFLGGFMHLSEGRRLILNNLGQDAQLDEKSADGQSRVQMKFWSEAVAKDRDLWRSVQATISNVTQSYGKTHSLNTVVSNLMTLTNTIAEYNDTNVDSSDPKGTLYRPDYRLSLHATKNLIQMMAPITPAFSEECWRLLNIKPISSFDKPILWAYTKILNMYHQIMFTFMQLRVAIKMRQYLPRPDEPFVRLAPNRPPIRSIFASPFPTVDGTFSMLTPTTRTCVVQVNGKMKCAVKIPMPEEGLSGPKLEAWLKEQILDTDEGRVKLTGKGGKGVDVRQAKKMIVIREGKTVNFVM
ncbi:leucyl-tRNA synthetase [Cadophora sp. DSE1049]|nr:leucyl-tRNA synthetase [Cadophora sp. DSE1049]